MTDTDDVALLELEVADLIDSTLALLLKIHLRFRGSFLRFHSMAVNSPNSAQLEGNGHTLPFPSYSRVRAVVWACGEGQTDNTNSHTDALDQYTFRVVYDSREM